MSTIIDFSQIPFLSKEYFHPPPNSLSSSMNGLISYTGAYMLSHFSHVQLFATLWIIACQAPLSMGFSRQE